MTEGLAATDRTDGALRAETGVDAPHRPNHPELDRLWARGREFLGADLAIMGGAMTWVSERHLVAAISEAGGFGVIACGAMSPQLLARQIPPPPAITPPPLRPHPITLPPP